MKTDHEIRMTMKVLAAMGQSRRDIARVLGLHESTVRYHLARLEPGSRFPKTAFKAEPWKEMIEKLRREKVETKALLDRLRPFGYTGSYSALYRYVVHLEGRTPEGFCRVEAFPGSDYVKNRVILREWGARQ